jgi:inhibitor of KinA sporulation pathway (predicted exonuclease)
MENNKDIDSIFYVCILDFEANFAKKDMKKLKMDNEVIEFPSVLLKINKNIVKKIGEIQIFCKPKFTPTLHPDCIDFTHITQDKVDNGIPFPDAMIRHLDWMKNMLKNEGDNFEDFVSTNKLIIVTCGAWDLNVMAIKEYKNHNMTNIHRCY